MHFLEDDKRVAVVGISGVGKSTVVSTTMDLLREAGLTAEKVVFGTIMFEEAQKIGVKHRDDIRKLPLEEQRQLQAHAASIIGSMHSDRLIVDTHLFVRTPEGYWPGLPKYVLDQLNLTNLILVEAAPQEILLRRKRDMDRDRDESTIEEITEDLRLARELLSSASVLKGIPTLIIRNKEGAGTGTALTVCRALGVGK